MGERGYGLRCQSGNGMQMIKDYDLDRKSAASTKTGACWSCGARSLYK